MTNRVTAAIQQAAGSFQRGDVQRVTEPAISKADAAGLSEPALSPEQRAGAGVEAALAASRFEASLAAHERFKKEKADYENQRDDEIWKRVLARRKAAIG
jgi:hypothetical protein